jgi:hypothetical protein
MAAERDVLSEMRGSSKREKDERDLCEMEGEDGMRIRMRCKVGGRKKRGKAREDERERNK